MGKAKTLTYIAILGAIVGYASKIAREDKFSDETKDKYDSFLNKAKNVGNDIQRTYTTIGDKKNFTQSTKNLTESTKKLVGKAGELVTSATTDIYKNAVDDVVSTFSKVQSNPIKIKVPATKSASKRKVATKNAKKGKAKK